MHLPGTSALVTGGASGLGLATARLLADAGASVVIADTQDGPGLQAAGEVGGIYVHADVTHPAAVSAAVEVAREVARLGCLVNCAGVGWGARTLARDGAIHDLDEFRRVIEVNLVGTFNCVRLAAAAMAGNTPNEEGERGVIVNTSSVAAFEGQVGQVAYAASKGGVVSMTLPLARDLSVAGIRVNTIAPGPFDTGIYGEGEAAEAKKARLAEDALFPARLGRPHEFARLVLEIVGNAYINGEIIRLDGGGRMRPK